VGATLLQEEEQKDVRVLVPNPFVQISPLNNKKDFFLLKNKGEKKISPFFIAQWMIKADTSTDVATPHHSFSKSMMNVGYIVTKKIGSSVVRNRVRRRLREALRLSLKNIDFQSFSLFVAKFVFIARKEILRCSFSDLQKKIEDSIRFSYRAMAV
jgi:ribonuclease P protein component